MSISSRIHLKLITIKAQFLCLNTAGSQELTESENNLQIMAQFVWMSPECPDYRIEGPVYLFQP